jgi:hypothetical protein
VFLEHVRGSDLTEKWFKYNGHKLTVGKYVAAKCLRICVKFAIMMVSNDTR